MNILQHCSSNRVKVRGAISFQPRIWVPDSTFRHIPLQLLPDVVGLILWIVNPTLLRGWRSTDILSPLIHPLGCIRNGNDERLWMMWIRRYWRVGSCRVTWVLVPECKAEQHFPSVAPRSRWVVPPFIDANLPSQVPQPACFWKFSIQAGTLFTICPNTKYFQSFPDLIAKTLFFFNH